MSLGTQRGRSRRLRLGRVPDPAKAHGAWVYLVLSILAGTLTAIGRGFLPALLVGVGFAGVFLCASAVALVGKRGMAARLIAGLLLAVAGPGAALYLGASPSFFALSLVALGPAALAGYCAEKHGIVSPQAMAFAVVALVVAAPSSACAGGASVSTGLLLLALLAPFFAYRTWRVRNAISSETGWTRPKLRKQGWMEVVYGLGWIGIVVLAFHLYALLPPL
ncbi:MAG: hypothetical protein OEM49_15100 [Myxococcales bacterium]|nr:hypothetical protein [Myxococcales bacterium]MDH5307423.1 hypothetical protein [Myxococcales bacterium]MDH5567996.1 hypothetical protein [Myxococcales bacterium]